LSKGRSFNIATKGNKEAKEEIIFLIRRGKAKH